MNYTIIAIWCRLTPTAQLLETGAAYFRISTVVLPLSAVAMVANGALRGAGDTVPGLISTILTRTVGTFGIAYVLAFPLGMGALGVWLALAIGTLLDALYMGWRWRGNAWLKVALHKTDLYRRHLHRLPPALQQQYLREVRQPFMAQPTARELVDEAGALYALPERNVQVTFDPTGYHLATV
jgi:hypothetical protein